MLRAPLADHQQERVAASLPFVESLARRMASTMPHSIDLGDLVQDGVLGLIDAAHRFDEGRGIKFETFAERRVRGAMIDALRRDAWPRGVRRVRRELEAAREELRRELGARADACRPGPPRRRRRSAPRAHHRPHQHHRVDVAAREPRHHRRRDAAGGARAERAAVAGSAVRAARSARSRARRARAAAAARAPHHRSLLLRRSDDEADRRARLASTSRACRSCTPAPMQRLRRILATGAETGDADAGRQRRPRVAPATARPTQTRRKLRQVA